MSTKSLPTFKHTSIGAKTQKPNTAKAHMSYIMRSEAMTTFQAENMPDGGRGTRAFFDKLWEKAGMPENARIADKLMLALPAALNQEQRYALVASFMHELGKGRIPWCAAHHDAGKDAHNPHAHILFKDADIDTGRKVVGTTTNSRDVREAQENGWKVPPRTTTADLRKRWCDHVNTFMERAGLDIRYDPRTLKQQGIDRKPQIHVGPKAEVLHRKGHEFDSGDYHRGERAIPYSLLDQNSRARHNAQIIEFNKRNGQAARTDAREDRPRLSGADPKSPNEQERIKLREAQYQTRRAMYQDQKRDREALRELHATARQQHREWATKLYAKARETAFQEVRKQYREKWRALRAGERGANRNQAAAALKSEQQASFKCECDRQIAKRRVDKDKAWKAMQAEHEKERNALRGVHREETAALARQHAAEYLAFQEKRRALSHSRQANRIDARISAHQGMVPQQTAANATIKLRQASQIKSADRSFALPVTPQDAANYHLDTARQEQQKQAQLRTQLTSQRMENIRRSIPAVDSAGVRQPPRRHVFSRPAIAKEDAQAKIRQAVESGRPLTDAERANAAPDLKQELARRDRREAIRWVVSHFGAGKQQDRGKGRTGGGRGR